MQSQYISLTSSTNASVTLTSPTRTENYIDTFGETRTRTRTAEFLNVNVVNVNGASPVYVRVDNVNPTVGGEDSYVVPAVVGASIDIPVNSKSVVVRMISGGNTQVGVIAE